jgi:hypothetical protein
VIDESEKSTEFSLRSPIEPFLGASTAVATPAAAAAPPPKRSPSTRERRAAWALGAAAALAASTSFMISGTSEMAVQSARPSRQQYMSAVIAPARSSSTRRAVE